MRLLLQAGVGAAVGCHLALIDAGDIAVAAQIAVGLRSLTACVAGLNARVRRGAERHQGGGEEQANRAHNPYERPCRAKLQLPDGEGPM